MAALQTELAKRLKVDKKTAGLALRHIIEIIREEITRGGLIKLQHLGTFSLLQTKERNCRNPITMKKMIASAKRRVKFKTSKTLKDELNK